MKIMSCKTEIKKEREKPAKIRIRGAKVHNLKDINVDIPLDKLVAIAGVSGSGKSSLALGVLYTEGSGRYLEALSTYTRRRIAQSEKALVDEIEYIPPALALRQRPGIPGVRSTFGTASELLNSIRLMFSRLGSHQCPTCGYYLPPSTDTALDNPYTCPNCGNVFGPYSAESFSFNSDGSCDVCHGTGTVMEIDDSLIVPDESKTIDEGAVLPWNSMFSGGMPKAVKELGVRTDVPFSELTSKERDIVFNGPEKKVPVLWIAKNGKAFDLNLTYYNARKILEYSLKQTNTETNLERIGKFMRTSVCHACHGTRLNRRARSTILCGKHLDEATAMTLGELYRWIPTIPDQMPPELRDMAKSIAQSFMSNAENLMRLGLDYLSLDRAASTLSNGERQRVQLAKAVRSRTTGALFILDEPSIGLHPANVDGLMHVIEGLLDEGNSVVMVDHDIRALRHAEHLIEMGPGAGRMGGEVIAQGSVEELENNGASIIGGYLSGRKVIALNRNAAAKDMFANGTITLKTDAIHTVHPLELKIPKGRLVAVTGVSGSGKTTLILESLIPALDASVQGMKLPEHIVSIEAEGIHRVNLIDSTPIGINVRSTVATYSNVLDELRKSFSALSPAKEAGYKTADFSYNTGTLRCPTCDGTGQISLDVQFLPDVDIICPDCRGLRYAEAAQKIRYVPKRCKGADMPENDKIYSDGVSLPDMMGMTVAQTLKWMDIKRVRERLEILRNLGLGYLTLGEATPSLSGGEAQRLKLASEMKKVQDDAVFVFDEPSIGLHPNDVHVLLEVFRHLVDNGATVIVIEHDLDIIANSDYVVDMGPGGGLSGGTIVATGTPQEIATDKNSITGKYLEE